MNDPFRPPSPIPPVRPLEGADEQPSRLGASSASLPADLAELLAAARAGRAPGIVATPGQTPPEAGEAGGERANTGVEHLLFVCANLPCAAPLAELREALPALPRTTPLPFSAPWLLGIFPLRTEIIGLADPVPMLLGQEQNLPLSEEEWAEWSANQPWALHAEAALMAVGVLTEPWRWGTWLHGGAVDVFGVSGTRSQPGAGNYTRQNHQFATLFASGGAGMFSRALLIGEGSRSLALVVNALGAISRARPDELSDSGTLGDPALLPFQMRYIAGVYAPKERHTADEPASDTWDTLASTAAPTGRRYLILRLKTLLDDMLDALEHEEAAR